MKLRMALALSVSATLMAASGLAQAAPSARALFDQKGCAQCHAYVARGLGPSVKTMMRKFKGDVAKATSSITAAKDHAGDPQFKTASREDLRLIAEWLASDSGPTGSGKAAEPVPEPAKPLTAAERKDRAAAELAAKRDAEAQARKEAAAKAKLEAEQKAAAKREAQENAKRVAEAKAAAKREADARARLDAEARQKKEAEAAAVAKREADEKARRDAQLKREADDLAKREADARAKKDTAALAALKREADDKAKRDAEQTKREAEAKAKRDAETQASAKRDAEEKAKREAEALAAQKRDAEAKARKDAEDKALREAEAQAKRDADAKAKREAEAQLAKKTEGEAKPKAERGQMKAPEKFRDEPCPPITASAPVGTVDESKAKEIIERVGCPQCHAFVQKKTGPPFKTVFQKVKDNPDCVIQRLKKNKEHNDEGVTADIKANEFKILGDYLATRAK